MANYWDQQSVFNRNGYPDVNVIVGAYKISHPRGIDRRVLLERFGYRLHHQIVE